jgi:hypothetical protein
MTGAVVAAVTGAAGLAWIEWRRTGRLRGARMMAAVTSAGCLLILALRPTRSRAVGAADATIVTQGAVATARAPVYAIGLARRGAIQAPDLGWIGRLRAPPASVTVTGWGLEEEQWPEAPDPPLPFNVEPMLAPPPPGISSITWPASLVLGAEAVVRGRVRPGAGSARVILADAGGALDSARLSSGEVSFTLGARPRATGRWRPTIRLDPARGVPAESLAIDVRPAPPFRVLLLESSPSFETRFLRDWLAARGAQVMTRTLVSRARSRVTGVNLPALDQLSRAALDSVGVVVLRGKAGAAPPPERRELDSAVRERGLGLVLVIDATPPPPTLGSEVLVRDGSGAPLAEVTSDGRGRVARTSVRNSAGWKLRGDSVGYAAFWALVLGAVRRAPDTALTVEGSGPHFVNRPAVVVARGDPGMQAVTVERDGAPMDSVYLAAMPGDSAARRGLYWPPRPGWYRLGGPGGSGFFVYDTSRWTALQAERRAQATLARAGPRRRTVSDVAGAPLPLWPAFLGFVLASGFLWWAQSRTRGSPRTLTRRAAAPALPRW